jgi:lipopolysaccharide transport system ATP-binding protein
MNAALLGLRSEQIESRFDDIVAFADIGDHIEQPVKTYSSGMLVRLAFAVIAHVDADVLVIDEALAVGDAFFTQKCMRFLRSFMQNGTVLFVSHDTASIKNLCDRAIWLDQGRVVASGTPKDVCEQYLEAFYEAQQGKSSSTRRIEKVAITGGATSKDQRSELINRSTLRNDLRVFEFNPDAASFGTGHARIRDVQLLNENGLPMSWIIGGEPVSLRIAIAAHEPLHNPIVGFFLKDSLGQTLFGDNTYLTYKDQAISIDPGEMFQASFAFLMPILPSGNYSIQVAIATGTQDAHVQHQWIHDALILKSESTSASTGLMGIPMSEISIRRIASPDS